MKSAKWLVWICRKILSLVVVLCVIIAIFVFSCYLVRQYETFKASEGFKRNMDLFENVIKRSQSLVENVISSGAEIAGFSNRERHYTVSEEMIEVGVEEIYSWKGNVFFGYKQRVLLMFPQGIVYVQQKENLPTWMKLTQISGQWYYYRIVS